MDENLRAFIVYIVTPACLVGVAALFGVFKNEKKAAPSPSMGGLATA